MAVKPYNSLPPVCGSVKSADSAGFAALIAEANRVSVDGYELLTVVRLDSKIAGVFRRRVSPAAIGDSFFE